MYSAHSPTLSSAYDEHHLAIKQATSGHLHNNHHHRLGHYSASFTSSSHPTPSMSPNTTTIQPHKTSVQCLRLKYFTTFFVCTTCLVLLSASLATHKWLVSKPIRVLRLNNGQTTNFTALMLTVAQDEPYERPYHEQRGGELNKRLTAPATTGLLAGPSAQLKSNPLTSNHLTTTSQQPSPSASLNLFPNELSAISISSAGHNSKFQGEIYFGLFSGVKVLNHGFGSRVSQISVVQAYFNSKESHNNNPQARHELINFRFWLVTLTGVVLAILFALVGSIFAIINFVMTPRGTMTGPVGLVIWNAAACFSCLMSLFAWLVEYFIRLKANVLTPEEVQNGWTSENRSQFGYSYYFVVLAFILHLVNIFIVSIVQSETWTSKTSDAAKRQARLACEGVIMLY